MATTTTAGSAVTTPAKNKLVYNEIDVYLVEVSLFTVLQHFPKEKLSMSNGNTNSHNLILL